MALHHATGASKSISALYMSAAISSSISCCPIFMPLILIGGGGSDILFHVVTMGLGVIGGLYEHSGYDFGLARKDAPVTLAGRLLRLIPASFISSHAHGQHHRRSR